MFKTSHGALTRSPTRPCSSSGSLLTTAPAAGEKLGKGITTVSSHLVHIVEDQAVSPKRDRPQKRSHAEDEDDFVQAAAVRHYEDSNHAAHLD